MSNLPRPAQRRRDLPPMPGRAETGTERGTSGTRARGCRDAPPGVGQHSRSPAPAAPRLRCSFDARGAGPVDDRDNSWAMSSEQTLHARASLAIKTFVSRATSSRPSKSEKFSDLRDSSHTRMQFSASRLVQPNSRCSHGSARKRRPAGLAYGRRSSRQKAAAPACAGNPTRQAFHHSKPLQRYNHCAARVARTFSERYMVPCVAVAKLPQRACAAGIVAL